MPELPEVTTTVNGLQKVLPGLIFLDVWTDLSKEKVIKQFEDTIKSKSFFATFKKQIKNQKILSVERRAKNILINLSNKKTILMHLKMTGHIIIGKYIYNKKENKWTPDKNEKKELRDPYNRFIHAVFPLSNGKAMIFCDSRKFGKITLIPTKMLYDIRYGLHALGPEPLEKSFTFPKFKNRLLLKPNWKIKTVLMNQTVIAGIGNIYSDEMLWFSDIHPESNPKNIPKIKLLKLFNEMKEVLTKGIDFGGDSMSDYRNIDGQKGEFQNHHRVYRKKDTMCSKKGCHGVIMREVINGRSAHFCSSHQKLFNNKNCTNYILKNPFLI